MKKIITAAPWLICLILAGFNGLLMYNNYLLKNKVIELQELQYTYQNLKFDKYIYEFGELKTTDKAVAVFNFTNLTSQTVQIKNVKTACGCTTPEWPKGFIKPNDKGQITVTYDTRIPGKFIKQLQVELTPSFSSSILLTIMGDVN